MRSRSIIFFLLLFFISGTAFAQSDPIGTVKTAKGKVMVIRGEVSQPAEVGFKILLNDFIRTGKDGAVGIIFIDDTILSLGPKTELILDEYVFEPQNSKLSMVIKMIKGTASYFSGIIGKQSPESVKFKTPDATIGIRGTKFLVKVD